MNEYLSGDLFQRGNSFLSNIFSIQRKEHFNLNRIVSYARMLLGILVKPWTLTLDKIRKFICRDLTFNQQTNFLHEFIL